MCVCLCEWAGVQVCVCSAVSKEKRGEKAKIDRAQSAKERERFRVYVH